MARSKRKRCRVWITKTVMDECGKNLIEREVKVLCEGKIKPGTPFCKEHFETHKLIDVKCTGEAHSNPWIDNCWGCAPHWGHYPVAVLKEAEGKPWVGSWD